MEIEVGTFWKYRDSWTRSLYEVIELHEDGVIMKLTYGTRTFNVFRSCDYVKNNLMLASIDDVIADHPIL